MRDLAAVDLQLAELGPELGPRQVSALLDRLLGNDRSLARLIELLDSLGAGPSANVRSSMLRDALAGPAYRPSPRPARGSLPPRIVSPLSPAHAETLKTATPWPPVASVSRSVRDTLVDASVPPPALPQIDEHELDAETAALFGITMPPVVMSREVAAAAEPAQVEWPAALPAVSSELSPFNPFASEPAAEAENTSRGARSTLQWASAVNISPSVDALAPSDEDGASPVGESAQTRASIRELLDQELDPNEFPSTHPPRARSVPPPQVQPEPAPVEAQDGFEMLIDDSEDDIMEIDDMELEEIE